MSTAFRRNMRYQGRIVLITLGYTAATVVALILWSALISPLEYLSQNIAIFTLGALVFSAFLWSASIYLTMYTATLPLVLTYSTTRKASFWACQAGKVIYAVGTGILGLLCAALVHIMMPTLVTAGFAVAILAVFIVLVCSSIMELTGLIVRRFGKIGFILYIGVCCVLGMCVGVAVAMSNSGSLVGNLLEMFESLSAVRMLALSCGAMLVLSGICTAISGAVYHKMSA